MLFQTSSFVVCTPTSNLNFPFGALVKSFISSSFNISADISKINNHCFFLHIKIHELSHIIIREFLILLKLSLTNTYGI
jgi:hypothetical protein